MTWSRCPAGLRRDSAVCFLMPKFLIRELVADMLSVLCCSKAVLRFSKLLRCTNWATIIFSGFCFLGMWDPWVACLAALVVSTGRACQQVWQEDLAFSFTTFGSVFSLTCNSVPYEVRMAIASFSVLSTIRRPEQYRLQICASLLNSWFLLLSSWVDTQCVPVFVTTILHMCYLIIDPFWRTVSVGNKPQVGLTFPYVSGFCLPVVSVEHSLFHQICTLVLTFACSGTALLNSYLNTADVTVTSASSRKQCKLDWLGLWSYSVWMHDSAL